MTKKDRERLRACAIDIVLGSMEFCGDPLAETRAEHEIELLSDSELLDFVREV